MELDLKGKVALVTGASLGIGKGICLELAREGMDVAVCARREGPLEETKAEIEALGARCLAIPADVTKKEDIERVVADTLATWGRLDVLVNNAGGGASTNHTVEDPDEVWEHCYDLNFWHCIRFTRAAIQPMKKNGGGSVINISSVGGHSAGWPGISDYGSAKAAVLMLTKNWAIDFAQHNIRVNAVTPALIHSPLWDELAKEFVPELGKDAEEVMTNLGNSVPRGRMGHINEVGYLVAFLASEAKAGFITGVVWDIDGGWTKSI